MAAATTPPERIKRDFGIVPPSRNVWSWERRQDPPGVASPFDLADELPTVVTAIRLALVTRGAGPEAAEDIAQEAATRAIESGIAFGAAINLRRWCFRVAWNLNTDDGRMRQRHRSDEPVPELVSAEDLDARVQYRLAEQEMLAALWRLTNLQQTAVFELLAELEEPAVEGDHNSTDPARRWRRYAARQRLKDALKNYPVVLPLDRLERWVAARRSWAWRAAAVAAAVVPVVLSLSVAIPDSAPEARLPDQLPRRAMLDALASGQPVRVRTQRHGNPSTVAHRRSPADAGSNRAAPSGGRELVRVVDPTGAANGLQLRPNGSDKPMLCVGVGGLAEYCFDKPTFGIPPR
jgi:DNA-directed RNA polymerase specialized sigma24 family protein